MLLCAFRADAAQVRTIEDYKNALLQQKQEAEERWSRERAALLVGNTVGDGPHW